jgi:hypothetical protein
VHGDYPLTGSICFTKTSTRLITKIVAFLSRLQNREYLDISDYGKVGVPASGRELISLLDKKSPKNESDPVSLKE